MKNKMLLVYNTCGINKDNTDWYIHCIESFLSQNFEGFRVVLSSCLNSKECIQELANHFKNRISYCYYSERYTVNVTFNKTVQESVKKYGNFEYYVYIDSGCTFEGNSNVLEAAYNNLKDSEYGMLSLQVTTDEGLQAINPKYLYQTRKIQIKDENLVIPLGKACNGHVIFHSADLLEAYNNKLWPDVFAAYCTESTFTFLCAAIKKRWAILKDIKIEHVKAVDGPSSSVSHISKTFGNPWNNLLYGRDALEFINDPEAIECGLGYEECNNIMMHKKDAYDENSFPIKPKELLQNINKYFFLNSEELDYETIECRLIG